MRLDMKTRKTLLRETAQRWPVRSSANTHDITCRQSGVYRKFDSVPRYSGVDFWKNSNQKHRWLAAALIDIEPRLRGHRHLPKLREALMRELKLDKQERVA